MPRGMLKHVYTRLHETVLLICHKSAQNKSAVSFNFAKWHLQRPQIKDLMCAIGFWGLNWPWNISQSVRARSNTLTLAFVHEKHS